MRLTFSKFHGTGNDFILVDNRKLDSNLDGPKIAKLCDRKYGIGADGLMLLQLCEGYDFEMIYYNADGAFPSMCGNGARCCVEFARRLGLVSTHARFLALDGQHEALIVQEGLINLRLADVQGVVAGKEGESLTYHFLDTGVPHMVRFVSNLPAYDVATEGRRIRHNTAAFGLPGTNANFVERLDAEGPVHVRTYERGVEAETLSCGTGVTACALVCSLMDAKGSEAGTCEYSMKTLGGLLKVKFEKTSDSTFSNIWLEGPATFVFQGEISI